MNTAEQTDLLEPTLPRVAEKISDRLSQELIIGLVGPVGSGVSTAAGFIADILGQDFGYEVAPTIKLSDIIRAEAHRVGASDLNRIPLDSYIVKMQKAGNELRSRFGPNYLAEKAVERIVKFRHDHGGYTADGNVLLPGRRAYIVDSIKNEEELDLFRQIYGDSFCLVGIFAPDEMRKQRLIDGGANPAEVGSVIDRDQADVPTFGQMTRKIFVESDFFVCNDQKPEEMRRSVARFLNLLFDSEIHTPTKSESAMYKANAVASNSACMSRQVGASIVSNEGELIAVGWNDVPKYGGGLYSEDDNAIWDDATQSIQDRDHRCFKWGSKICHNEVRRNKILDDISDKIIKSGIVKKGTKPHQVRDALAGTAVDSLIEFSRSIHAEMEAIVAVAREGRHSLKGATLYCTTYPCHNCARHIVAAGISTVVYIRPYQKSLATSLHEDAVTESRSVTRHVVFRQYEGVSPRNYLRLFQPTSERKEKGHLKRQNRKTANPILRIPLDGPLEYESKVIADLSSKEQTAGLEHGGR